MAEGIALLSVYGDADSDNDDLDDSPAATAAGDASIVDYAHDEGHGEEGAKPEAVVEEEEVVAMEVVVEVEEVVVVMEEEVNVNGGEEEIAEPVATVEEDVFAGFWPSPPSTPCSEDLEAKFAKFLKFKEQGRNFNDDLRKSKGYRNPDFLQLAVMHQNIDETGSCFNPEVFDPHGYPSTDYADALAAEQRKEADRKEQERRQSQRTTVDFVRATQLLTSQKVSLAAAAATGARLAEGAHTVVNTTTSVHTTTTSEVRSETRANKKSKWDKASHH